MLFDDADDAFDTCSKETVFVCVLASRFSLKTIAIIIDVDSKGCSLETKYYKFVVGTSFSHIFSLKLLLLLLLTLIVIVLMCYEDASWCWKLLTIL